MKIEYLEWDSIFFGKKIGRLLLNEDVSFDSELFLIQVLANNYDLVYVFKFQSMLSNRDIIKGKLDLVDIQLTMSKKNIKNENLNFSYDYRTELSKNELNECYAIAEVTSKVSRFYNEKKIGPELTKALYRKWIDNAINKQFSDGLFIFKESKKITGIHLIKTDEKNKLGYCSMIGVSSDGKRKGIGSNLWAQAFSYWSNETNIEVCKVPFSLQNTESFNFHLKMGFNKVEELKYIYHFRNERHKIK